MNNQQARLILRACRPSGQDASDALIAEALEQARRDPELQKWFLDESAFDLHIQAKLRTTIMVPPELKANLLGLPQISSPRSRWRRPLWLAVAAALILLLGLSAFWMRPANTDQLDSFRKTMAGYSMRKHGHIVFEASDMAKIQQWFQTRGFKSDFDLPNGLRGKAAEGCRVVDWNSQKAALICFILADGNHVDLFVMDRAGFSGLSDKGVPQFAQAGNLETVTWSKGGKIYLLTGDGDKELLKKLIQQT